MRQSLKKIIKVFLRSIDNLFVVRLNRNAAIKFFYLIFRNAFWREQSVVSAGRSEYLRAGGSVSRAELRRSIHRLEKGLLMRPRRPGFAVDYILSTVQAYSRVSSMASSSSGDRSEELLWAHDVLRELFDSVSDDSPELLAAREWFEKIKPPRDLAGSDDARRIPASRSAGLHGNIRYDDFIVLCRQRRSVRWFLQTPIPSELVHKAIAASLQAPSACNRQPFFFRYFGDNASARRVANIAMGTRGYADQIPALLVLLGDWSAFEDERDRHLPYIDGALAAMQFMLALETMGLASCPINWPDIDILERRMESELQLPPYVRPIMLIAIGYADPEGGVAYSAKKSVDEVLY